MIPRLVCALLAAGYLAACDHDYTGHYDMTYAIALDYQEGGRAAIGGNALVEIRDGYNDQLLIDLGRDFCQLFSVYDREAEAAPPFLRIDPQACVFAAEPPRQLTITGVATSFEKETWEETDFSISLRGNFDDESGRGVVTVDFLEVW